MSGGSLEQRLHNPQAQVSYDILAGREGGAKLYSQLSWVYMLNQSSDYAPAQGLQERLEALVAELAGIDADYTRFRDGELARSEQLATTAGLPRIILPAAP